MNTETVIQTLSELKIVPVIALENAEDAVPLGQVLLRSGINVAEITFRSAVAEEAIRRMRNSCPNIIIAAGTVLNAQQAQTAKNAGADFIVSPGFNPNTVKACQDMNIPITPGVNTPSAIEAALEHGINAVKFFPAEASGGIATIKALLGPYGMLKIMPTGGINKNNIRNYLAIDAVIACGGSWMVDKKLLQTQNWSQIEQLCREAKNLVA